MNKKILVVLIVIVTSLLAYVFIDRSNEKTEQELQETREIKEKVSVKKSKEEPKQVSVEVRSSDESKDDDFEKALAIQDEVDNQWSVKVLKFFSTHKLQMTIQEYHKLRESYSEDFFDIMDNFHDELEDGQKYNPTEEPPEIIQLNEKYHEILLNKLGKDSYVKFLDMRDRFNEDIFEKYPGKNYIYTEF